MNEIGMMLRGTRENNGVSLEEASEDLSIKSAILNNIEEGNMGCFKDIFELKEYIKNYAKYLGINPKEIEDKFNEFMFETTSKIPVEEIEKQIKEKQKLEATSEIKIQSPYTDKRAKYRTKSYVMLYILVTILVAIVIFWAVCQVTVGNSVTTVASSVNRR